MIPLIDTTLSLSRRLSIAMMRIAGGAMLLSAFAITVEVLARRLLGMSSFGADEYSYYILAISMSWSLTYALLEKAHIRIDAIISLFPINFRIWFDVIALAALAFTGIYATQAIYTVVIRSWDRGTTSLTTLGTPMWVPQGLFLIGFLFFAGVATLLLARLLLALFFESNPRMARHLFGTPSVNEETGVVIQDTSSKRGEIH